MMSIGLFLHDAQTVCAVDGGDDLISAFCDDLGVDQQTVFGIIDDQHRHGMGVHGISGLNNEYSKRHIRIR
jgi:hypothetical protein